MCKHVAAVLYGIGARLDQQPELLFRLHDVDEKQLIAGAGKSLPLATKAPAAKKVLGGEDLSALFGLDMATDESPAKPRRKKAQPAKTAPAVAVKKGKATLPGAAKRVKQAPAAKARGPKKK